MKKYYLKQKDKKVKIVIDKSVKEDFKKLMNWTEEQFKENTVKSEIEK